MILIDKLCYLSKLRYVNPMEKFAFAMLTLIFCMVSRSIVMGLFVIVLNSWLTVVRGGISAKRYRNLMMVPLVFLAMSTIAIVLNISKTPLVHFCDSHRQLFYHRKPRRTSSRTQACRDGAFCRVLPVFSVL